MNLKVIDAKKDYIGISKKSPANFYFNLAERLVQIFGRSTKDTNTDLSIRVLGNPIRVQFTPDSLKIEVAGKTYSTNKVSISGLENLIYSMFQDEVDGNLTLSRPDGRNVLQDRLDFNKASSTIFTRLHKSVTKDEFGRERKVIKGSRNKAAVLTESEFKLATTVKTFNSPNFKRLVVGGTTLFVNKSTQVIRINKFINEKEEDLSEYRAMSVISNQSGNLGYWARTPELSKLSTCIDDMVPALVIYKDWAWLVTSYRYEYKVEKYA